MESSRRLFRSAFSERLRTARNSHGRIPCGISSVKRCSHTQQKRSCTISSAVSRERTYEKANEQSAAACARKSDSKARSSPSRRPRATCLGASRASSDARRGRARHRGRRPCQGIPWTAWYQISAGNSHAGESIRPRCIAASMILAARRRWLPPSRAQQPTGRGAGRGGAAAAARDRARRHRVPRGPDRDPAAQCMAPELPPPSILDYRPRSTLVAGAHMVKTAKYPAIDFHGHPQRPDLLGRGARRARRGARQPERPHDGLGRQPVGRPAQERARGRRRRRRR